MTHITLEHEVKDLFVVCNGRSVKIRTRENELKSEAIKRFIKDERGGKTDGIWELKVITEDNWDGQFREVRYCTKCFIEPVSTYSHLDACYRCSE